MTEDDIRIQVEGHRERNRVLCKTLLEKGLMETDVVDAEMQFWAPDHRTAALLGKALYERGYLVLVIKPAAHGGKEWNVEAGQRCKILDAVSDERTATLVRLAAGLGATYDGWGASVKPRAVSKETN